MSDKHRLFVAFDVPLAERERLNAAMAHLEQELPGGRWTPIEAQHVTLKFLGWVPAGEVGDVTEVCRAVASRCEGAELRLDGLGVFASPRRLRVLWVGIADAAGVTSRLAAALDKDMVDLGIPAESRDYTPHLTLARFKVPLKLDSLPELDIEGEPFGLDAIVLYQSHLSPRGARYEVVERFPLA